MSNPLSAWTPHIDNPREYYRKLERAWDSFVATGKLCDNTLRPLVKESWERCSSFGINPRLLKARTVLSEEELYLTRIQNELAEVVQPYLQVLAENIVGTNHVAVLCDTNGRIVELVGDAYVRDRAADINFALGADWSEEGAGTNAIGTAIKSRGPVQVFSAEHYCQGWHPWTCSAAPIHDPISKEIIGVLDLTGFITSHQPHSLGFVVAQVFAIEQQLSHLNLMRQQCLTNKFWDLTVGRPHDGVLAVDIRGRVTQLNDRAALQLGIQTSELIGQTLEDFPSLRHAVLDTIQFGEPDRERELRVLDNRLHRELRFVGKPVTDKGKLVGALVTFPNSTRSNLSSSRSPANLDKEIDRSRQAARYSFSELLGHNERFISCIKLAKRAAGNSANVLIRGESGTGKELIAQAIHLASERVHGPFVALNCGALPKELIASELFGYTDGAFTGAIKGGRPGKFELAHGGTIFLDEIGDMPLDQQVNLLRVLQEKEVVRIGGQNAIHVNVRIIAATNKILAEEIERNNFREDLFYRLNVISINLPPLRERQEDVKMLGEYFLDNIGQKYGKQGLQMSPEVVRLLEAYHWPGNVRELQNVVERAIHLAWNNTITPDCLPPEFFQPTIKENSRTNPRLNRLEQLEREMLLSKIEECSGNMTRTAAELQISRSTLYRKLSKYKINMQLKFK